MLGGYGLVSSEANRLYRRPPEITLNLGKKRSDDSRSSPRRKQVIRVGGEQSAKSGYSILTDNQHEVWVAAGGFRVQWTRIRRPELSRFRSLPPTRLTCLTSRLWPSGRALVIPVPMLALIPGHWARRWYRRG